MEVWRHFRTEWESAEEDFFRLYGVSNWESDGQILPFLCAVYTFKKCLISPRIPNSQ